MAVPTVKLSQGIHVMHLFYRIDRALWAGLPEGTSLTARTRLESLCGANSSASSPRLCTYTNIGGKADLVFFILAPELQQLGQIHRSIEACFPPGALQPVFSYLSVTELTDYMPNEEDNLRALANENLEPGSEAHTKRLEEMRKRMNEYSRYRLYPELPDWEIMCFYPMNKKRNLGDNWYLLDFETRKRMMGGHAKTGRKFAGRVSQLITGSTGLDDWEWGVTLVAHQTDAIKEIVYEMRFDEVTARFGEFGEFYINLRLSPADLWPHLHL